MESKLLLDFWYNFDILFNMKFGQVPAVILNAYKHVLNLPSKWLILRSSDIENYPNNFIEWIINSSNIIKALKVVSECQVKEYNKLIDQSGNKELLIKAFASFGQGLLYDDNFVENSNQPRRPDDEKIHMMDNVYLGYPRWYIYCRAAVIAGQDQEYWTDIGRFATLAYTLHLRLEPRQSVNGEDPKNKEDETAVSDLLTQVKNANFDQLDSLYDNLKVREAFGMSPV